MMNLKSDCYLTVKRARSHLELGLSALPGEFTACCLVLWLLSTESAYKRKGINSAFDAQTQAFLDANRDSATQLLSSFSGAGQLLVESIRHAYETNRSAGADRNLSLISAALEHAQAMRALPVVQRSIRYSVRRHPESRAMSIMTVRSDVQAEFGLPGGMLVLSSLSQAIGRDLDKQIMISEWHELFDEPNAPADFGDPSLAILHIYLVDYLTKALSLAQVKSELGAIKVLGDYFDGLSDKARA